MGGSLTGNANRVRDVYKKLVFYNSTDEKFYRDNGIQDVELPIASDFINASDDYFRFSTSATLTSGNVVEFRNNTDTVFSVDYQGVAVLKGRSSVPSVVANGLYSDGDNLYFGKNE